MLIVSPSGMWKLIIVSIGPGKYLDEDLSGTTGTVSLFSALMQIRGASLESGPSAGSCR